MTTLYRIGLKPNCPVHQLVVGGGCTVKRTQKVTGRNANTKRNDVNGVEMCLTDEQINAVIKGVKNRVIRSTTGKKRRSRVYVKSNKFFRPEENDKEASAFVYIEELEEKESSFQAFDRPSLEETHRKSLEVLKSKAEEVEEERKRLEKEKKAFDSHNREMREALQADYNDLDAQRAALEEEKSDLAKMLEEVKKAKEELAKAKGKQEENKPKPKK